MDQIADLILTPFRDIVEKGRIAVDVAGSGHPEMAKAAQSLIKEGGRALKRIEPQCQRHADEFGTSFIDAVKASDEIAAFRTELNDLLWEFDDYTELDHFDASKYTELQQASRQAAPRIYDILMRMRIEPLANRPISIYGGSSNDNGSMNAFPHLGISTTNDETDTNNSFVPSPHPHNTATGHSHQRSTASVSQLDAIGIHHQKPQGIALNPEAILQPQTSHFQQAPAMPLSQPSAPAPPEPPSENPWDISLKPGVGQAPGVKVASPVPDTSPLPALPSSLVKTCSHPCPAVNQPRSDSTMSPTCSHPLTSTNPSETRNPGPEPSTILPKSGQHPLATNPHSLGQAGHSHDPDFVASPVSTAYDGAASTDSASRATTASRVHVPPTTAPEGEPIQSDSQSQALPSHHFLPEALTSQHLSASNSNHHSPIAFTYEKHSSNTIPPTSNSGSSQAFLVSMSGASQVAFDDGPIPIETESPTQQSSSSALIGPNSKAYNPVRITNDSSYHIFKGFCKGARAVLNGEEGITPVRKKTLTGSRVVARCIHYRGNFTFGGMGFRPRLLQKSHVATRRNDEQFYACLICVDLEQTVEESDATIFFTQNDLLSHLSRHPQPFPDIDKLKIVQSPTVPENLINNYDLHVKSPPANSLTVEKSEEISNMPTAICKETIKSIYGMRTLNDHTPVFEMAEGARIVGIKFLERYEGEWCMGYHDNRYASFPFDVVRLEPPPAGQIQRKSTSTVQAVARWKFTPRIKGKNDWLTFNKGDLISNIAFVSPNHWCWSGTNSKGKWGFFLASHVDPTSIKERAMTGDSLSSATSGNSPPTRASGIFGLFTPKKKTDRKSPLPLAW
ncbi:hypothetical protein CFIMG_007377RA00001 [Ceratocystis fimbriata CBS 114723]|uniref:SH3 domain-containing protein n=1 Tax=Ceratocystis fimbriata CBS 114723 TaxID=1035309 RepID=A0A2C5WY06_9PEZI|nr:hypothetical protein CFIMG_007377RA00001 [Ceratocystis fimbriata CBS 114723]